MILSLQYLRGEVARTEADVDALLERLDLESIGWENAYAYADEEEKALERAEGEQARAWARLELREQELVR